MVLRRINDHGARVRVFEERFERRSSEQGAERNHHHPGPGGGAVDLEQLEAVPEHGRNLVSGAKSKA